MIVKQSFLYLLFSFMSEVNIIISIKHYQCYFNQTLLLYYYHNYILVLLLHKRKLCTFIQITQAISKVMLISCIHYMYTLYNHYYR